MRVLISLLLIVTAGGLFALGASFFPSVMDWAVTLQRTFQNEMAGAVRAIRSGARGGWAALMAAAGAYGVVHAAGPGHGKYLIGGVGMATSVPASKMIALAVASSLAQALWAVIIVYGGFFIFQLSADRMTVLAEDWLAPASYLAIGVVGAVLISRGARSMMRSRSASHDHSNCNHAHGPDLDQVAGLTSYRDAAALVASIAIRPCTGAIFLLVIAWQLDIKLAGFAAVVVMGLGTAILTSSVAISSVALRGLTMFSGERAGGAAVAASTLQVLAGILVIWISLTLLSVSLL